jgi:HEAT repeat protein
MGNRAWVAVAALAGCAALWPAGCNDPAEGVNSSNSSEVRKSLNELGKRGKEEDVDRVAETTTHANPAIAAEAVRSLGSMHQTKAVEALTKVAAEETRSEVREEAVLELGRQKEVPSLDTLRQIVQRDPDPRVRAAAATSIARLRSWDDVALLMDVAEKDPDVLVQSGA